MSYPTLRLAFGFIIEKEDCPWFDASTDRPNHHHWWEMTKGFPPSVEPSYTSEQRKWLVQNPLPFCVEIVGRSDDDYVCVCMIESTKFEDYASLEDLNSSLFITHNNQLKFLKFIETYFPSENGKWVVFAQAL